MTKYFLRFTYLIKNNGVVLILSMFYIKLSYVCTFLFVLFVDYVCVRFKWKDRPLGEPTTIKNE